MEPKTFGQTRHTRETARSIGQDSSTFKNGESVRCFDSFVVQGAVACQIQEVRGLDSGGCRRLREPCHRPLLVVRVRANLAAGTSISRRAWTNDGHSSRKTRRELTRAEGGEGRRGAPRWVIREVAPAKSHNGHGHKMVESVVQQTERAFADGTPAHQMTTPAATARAD